MSNDGMQREFGKNSQMSQKPFYANMRWFFSYFD